MNKITFTISLIIVAIVFGGGGYYAGMAYSKSMMAQAGAPGTFAAGGTAGAGGQYGGRTRGGAAGAAGATVAAANGQVLSIDPQGITLATAGGGSKIVLTSSSTSYVTMSTTTASDITVGQNVLVTGSSNADGSISAKQVRITGAAGR